MWISLKLPLKRKTMYFYDSYLQVNYCNTMHNTVQHSWSHVVFYQCASGQAIANIWLLDLKISNFAAYIESDPRLLMSRLCRDFNTRLGHQQANSRKTFDVILFAFSIMLLWNQRRMAPL